MNKIINILDNKISYYEKITKNSNKESIVFCHGFDSSSLSFVPLINNLCNEYNCYAMSYPGHGHSTGKIKDMSIPVIAKTLKEFIKQKDLDKVHLVGHSLGGGVVSYLTSESYVNKVILLAPINPSMVGKEMELANILLPTTKDEFKNSMNALVADMKNSKVNLLDEKNVESQLKGIKARRPLMFKLASDVWKKRRQWEMLWNYLCNENETLVIFGDNDKIVPTKDSIKWLERIIKDVKIEVIKNCGHSPQFEKLEETTKLILSFLNKD